MAALMLLPPIVVGLFVFVFGLCVGSFLNVLVARLPFEKSVVWPGSRCFSCLRPLRSIDNLPLIGYLRLRGRCRFCGTGFSARYLWVELGTAVGFVLVFAGVIAVEWQHVPGLPAAERVGPFTLPSVRAWVFFAAHAALFSLLLASSVIDLRYWIIPPQLTYLGTLLGLAFSVAFPWPWPNLPTDLPVLPGNPPWNMPQWEGKLPNGVALWPVWGPPPDWAPAGSPQLGLLTSLVGAAAGMFVGRSLKFLFEIGFGSEAFGLGDADLLMMAGAFLGWQAAVLALPFGAVVLLPIVLPIKLWVYLFGRPPDTPAGKSDDPTADPAAVPFGPGIAAGVVAVWLCWPWLGELIRPVFFEPVLLLFVAVIMGGGLLAGGLILRRGPEPAGSEGKS